MPGYIERALNKFTHPPPRRPQNSPHASIPPKFGKEQQLTSLPDTSPFLDESGIRHVQEVVGTFLYHARCVNSPILPSLNTTGSTQAAATKQSIIAITQLLDYCAANPNSTLQFTRSAMILRIHSDASYLSVTKDRSRAAGFFYLSDNTNTSPLNGAIHVLCAILKNVMASAVEAETGAVFVNYQEAIAIRQTLIEIGHPQPATPVHVDNKCAVEIFNETFRQRKSKSMDMRFYWVRDRAKQKQFRIFGEKAPVI